MASYMEMTGVDWALPNIPELTKKQMREAESRGTIYRPTSQAPEKSGASTTVPVKEAYVVGAGEPKISNLVILGIAGLGLMGVIWLLIRK